MNRLSYLVLVFVFALFSVSLISAYDTSVDGLHRLADLMPDDLQIFMAVEISNDMFAKVDTFVDAIADKIPLTYPPEIREQWRNFSFNQAVTEEMLTFNIPWYDLYPLIGQYMGIGGSYKGEFLDDTDAEIWLVIDILDQQRMHDILLDVSLITSGRLVSTGEIITYEIEDVGTLSMTKTHLLLTNTDSDMFDIQPFSKNADFVRALKSLQEDRYDSMIYFSESIMQDIIEDSDTESFDDLDISLDGLDALMFGFAIQDNHTAILDISWQTTTPAIAPTFNPEMLKELPASTDFLMAGADFNILYESMIDFIRTSAEAQGDADPTPLIEVVLNYGKLDFEDDFLSWTTGTYVLFGGNDVSRVVEEIYTFGTSGNMDDAMTGIAFEATDPDKVVEFVETIGDVLDVVAKTTDDITIKIITLDDKPALNIIFNLPEDDLASPILNQVVLVPMDRFLYLGTVNGYEEIASGNILGNSPDFQIALDHTLNAPNSIFYMNSELTTIATTFVIMIADEPFNDLLREIQGSQFDDDEIPTVATYYDTFNWLKDVISNVAITSEVNEEGTVLMRLSMSMP